jgi:hypothetical protein
MQTSIEWLFEQMKSTEWKDKYIWHKEDVFEQAKEMHKQEIIESYCQGCKDISENDSIFPRETAEEYYQNSVGYKL